MSTVFTPLAPLSPATPIETPPELSEAEQEAYSKVLAHFSAESYAIPGIEASEASLTEDEKFWLTEECLQRYLRGPARWDTGVAIERLEGTLKWRREFGLYDHITAKYVEPEAVTGKEILFGYDVQRRPGFYMIPSRQNTTEAKRQIEFAVYMLERAIDLMGPGVETVCLLINFAERSKQPSFGTARAVLHILQTHYPERLGLAIAINLPFLVQSFFRLIMPFVDVRTRPKLKFNPNVISDGLFTPDQIMSEGWGGAVNFEYKHEEYWAALTKLCDEKRTQQKARWLELGGRVGLKEWDIKVSSAQHE